MATLPLLGLSSPGLVAAAAILAIIAGLAFIIISKKSNGSPLKPVAVPTPAANGVKTTSHVEVEPPADRVLILYGTQTGTAERFAKSLRSQLEAKYGGGAMQFVALDTEGYPVSSQLQKETCVLLLMATYGDGEPTDSGAEFYDWVVETVESGDNPDLLKSVTYGVFGLGNRQYEHFCAVGQRLHGALADLGATSLLDAGLGDDDDDIDSDFDTWTLALLAALDANGMLGSGHSAASRGADSVPAFSVTELQGNAAKSNPPGLHVGGRGTSAGDAFLARVVAARELHAAASSRSCVHVEVDVAGSSITYETGDHIGVFARNPTDVVAAAADALGLDPGMTFVLGPTDSGVAPHFTGPTTVGEALATAADLLGLPSKAALASLAAFAADAEQGARLLRLSSPEGKDDYHSHVVAAKRSLLEIMQEFDSARPSLGAFFASVADTLQPRYYSISSSPLAGASIIAITCAVVDEWMPSGRHHLGVASSFLAGLAPGDRLPVFVRRSTFRLPADPATPIVMVGPGTGLAPFRGFLQERDQLLRGAAPGALGPATLFFGCRQADVDFIYREELEGWLASGALRTLHTAFSRAGPAKDYVQHHIVKNAAEVWEALEAGKGMLYVCGDAKNMARDVNVALCKMAADALGGAEAGDAWLRALIGQGRYLRDVW